jgi:hypothetical protein
MRVFADDVICGVPAPAARELMRRYRRARPDESACRVLGVCQGLGTPGRVTAGRHLEQVVARARAYNADPGRLLTIASITVLGSCCIDPAGRSRDGLELAVSAVRREGDRDLYVRKVLAYARASGRRFDAFHELIYWPDRELRMILKNRSPAIRITDQDASSRTGHADLVFAVSEDLDAIAAAPGSSGPRLRAARSPVSPAWAAGEDPCPEELPGAAHRAGRDHQPVGA